MKRLGLFVITFAFALEIQAGSLSGPVDFESASVLPAKIRSPRYKHISLQMDQKFADTGDVTMLGSALNKPISFQNLVDTQKTSKDKALAEGTILANGLVLTDSPGETVGAINTTVNVRVPIFSYGLTDTTTLAVVVPVYEIRVSADTGYRASPEAQLWVNSICGSSIEKCNMIQSQLSDPVNLKLAANGYDRIKSEDVSAIGDVKLVTKSVIHKSSRDQVAIKGVVTAPTGVAPNADKLVDTATGDGQWDVGSRVIWDLFLSKNLTFNSFAGYTAQLPDTLERRVPLAEGDPISPQKEKVYRDSGDVSELGVSLTAGSGTRGLSFGAGYTYQYLSETKFRGTQYEQVRYRYLEGLNPSQELHTVTVGLGFSTIEDYREGRFVLPFSAGLYHSRPMSGRNTSNSDVYSAELVMFF